MKLIMCGDAEGSKRQVELRFTSAELAASGQMGIEWRRCPTPVRLLDALLDQVERGRGIPLLALRAIDEMKGINKMASGRCKPAS
jgi:hypothetical protein